jgi:ribosome recycling factor
MASGASASDGRKYLDRRNPFDAEEKMEKAVSVARDDLSSIAGRANPGMFSRLTIDYYGSATPIAAVQHQRAGRAWS